MYLIELLRSILKTSAFIHWNEVGEMWFLLIKFFILRELFYEVQDGTMSLGMHLEDIHIDVGHTPLKTEVWNVIHILKFSTCCFDFSCLVSIEIPFFLKARNYMRFQKNTPANSVSGQCIATGSRKDLKVGSYQRIRSLLGWKVRWKMESDATDVLKWFQIKMYPLGIMICRHFFLWKWKGYGHLHLEFESTQNCNLASI